jgi:hypothetical protein
MMGSMRRRSAVATSELADQLRGSFLGLFPTGLPPYFSNQEAALEHLERVRWPHAVVCPHCQSRLPPRNTTHSLQKWRCAEPASICGRAFSATTKTVLHSAKAGFETWLLAASLICLSHGRLDQAGLAELLAQLQHRRPPNEATLRRMIDQVRVAADLYAFEHSRSSATWQLAQAVVETQRSAAAILLMPRLDADPYFNLSKAWPLK